MLETRGSLPEVARQARLGAVPLQEGELAHLVKELARERTFESLSAALGEDKAKGVVTSIGVAALTAAPELNGAGLGSVVAQALARLTQAELIGISRNESSAVGRAQAIIQEEVKVQKLLVSSTVGGIGAAAGSGSASTLAQGGGLRSSSRFAEIKESDRAASLAREAGAKPGDTSLFSGVSDGMRDTIRNFIQNGKPITDDVVRNIGDVQAVIGLIRSGKLDPNDPRIPPSVRKIIEDMKRDGIDPTTAKADEIKDWFRRHPNALEVAKARNDQDIEARKTLTDADLAARRDQRELKAAEKASEPAAKPSAEKTATSETEKGATKSAEVKKVAEAPKKKTSGFDL